MNKNIFLDWGNKKYEINNSNTRHFVKKRQFWLYNIGVNIGNEESKNNPFLRPCLILNNYFKGDLILVLPLTSKFNEKLSDIYYKIEGKDYGLDRDSYLLLNQFSIISKKRLIRKIDKCGKDILFRNSSFLEVLSKVKDLI